jgi:hypothetical protein
MPRLSSLTFALFLAVVPTAHAGQATTAPAPRQVQATVNGQPAQVVVTDTSADADQVREQLENVLRQYPPSLGEVLRNDPSLLQNDGYLASYPALAAFLASHPQVGHNPAFYVGTSNGRPWREDNPQQAIVRMWENTISGLQVLTGMALVAMALGWLIKSLLDYRRWLRLSKVQTEVHSKLVDRFASNEDLLNYIQTPAGRKFLESAPIPLDAAPQRSLGAPINRILWSVQAGVVIACAGLGLLYVSGRQIPEISQPLYAMGSLALAVGLGFVVSAIVSYFLSRRLGLVDGPGAGPSAPETADVPR